MENSNQTYDMQILFVEVEQTKNNLPGNHAVVVPKINHNQEENFPILLTSEPQLSELNSSPILKTMIGEESHNSSPLGDFSAKLLPSGQVKKGSAKKTAENFLFSHEAVTR